MQNNALMNRIALNIVLILIASLPTFYMVTGALFCGMGANIYPPFCYVYKTAALLQVICVLLFITDLFKSYLSLKLKLACICLVLALPLVITVDVLFFEEDTNEVYSPVEEVILPTFEQYPVEVAPTSLSALPPINLDSNEAGSRFETTITEVNSELPNFAGKYSLITWGCGSNCKTGVIVDRSTGTIISWLPIVMEYGYEARPDSSLIIFNPFEPQGEDIRRAETITYYMNWNGKSFDLVSAFTYTREGVAVATTSIRQAESI